MQSETAKTYLQSLLSAGLSELKMASVLDSEPQISVPDPQFVDFSTNLGLVLAKKLKTNPKELADKLAVEFKKHDTQKVFEEITVAGGFVNFKLSPGFLLQNLEKILEQRELYGASLMGGGKTMVVEYFQNNVAKPPHVGHLRSAVIGDCLLRILKSQGYKTISDTHIGDWGVQFGILLFAYKEFIKAGGKKEQLSADPINELNKLYVGMSAQIEAEPDFREKGKEEFVKLEKGDTENRELWQLFVRVSLDDFERYRQLLQILPFDHNLGESFYEDKMPAVLEELKAKGVVKTGETGEQYVDLEEFGLGRCILVKSDGGTTYHMRDFATYIYRRKEFEFHKNIYIVDNRQAHHFRQLFKALELAGYPTAVDSVHVDLGFMSLPEGAISTRKGTTISLQNLIDEAQKRALAIIQEKNPDLQNKQAIATEVALAAIKYFDLSHNRKTEIVFTWDKALSFEGNTGPYLQYTHARIHGILRKAGQADPPWHPSQTHKSADMGLPEKAVLGKLVLFPEVLAQIAEEFLPNVLCNYLFELSQSFNQFYETSPVMQEKDEAKRHLRLAICSATAQVISNGLYLLGINAPEEM